MRKQKSPPDDTPSRIIHATLDLLAEKGSDALRTREILARANVSNLSAVSYYFGSLENLRRCALERYFEGIRPALSGIDEAKDARQALLEYCRNLARFVLENPSLERNIVSLAMSGDPAASAFAHIVQENMQALQRLIRRGRNEADPQKAAFDAIVLASATIYPLLLASYGLGTVGIDALNENDRERYFTNLVGLVLGP